MAILKDAVQDGGENTSHVAVSVVTIPQQGWGNLEDFSEIAWFDFTMSSTLDFFLVHKEGDGLPADNLKSISSHCFGLYSKGYCREGEVC